MSRHLTVVDYAMFNPGCCMVCGSSEGKMIDTCVDIPGDGRMYLCVRICGPQILALLGGEAPKPMCKASKVNGEPCAAQALPGHEFCVAHVTKEVPDAVHQAVVQ